MKYRPKHIVEYLLLAGAGGLVRLLPLRVALGLGWLVAAAMHYLGGFRRQEALRRLTEVYGDRFSAKQRRRMAWISWRNLCFNAVEAIRFSKLTREDVQRQPLAQEAPRLSKALEEEQHGYIFATIHMGNWDMAGVTADLMGIPIFSIARRQKNPLTDAYLNRARNAFDMEVILNDSKVLKGVIRRIKQGKVLAILPDVRNRTEAFPIRFLNGEANLGAGVALFARQCNCPIYPAVVRRVGWTRHEAVVFDPIRPDPTLEKTEDWKRIMQQMMDLFNEEIAKTPEQYFWYNKRWVLDPI
ncbi:lysophospholipid acyltransferase family protein [Pontiella sp.]|uniref:lysophospholipid acyltransferase family protein n=1 Tax=Pontiella sp. TaxID=2837462 RepID=UPI003566FA80